MRAHPLDLARANLYRYLSVAPLPPDDPRFDLLRHAGFREVVRRAVELLRTDAALHPESLGPGEIHPSRVGAATALLPDGEEAATSYVAVFGHSISKECPPYEVEYHPSREISSRTQRLADVAGFYRAFGLDRAPKARERVDHLSFEAEFMQIAIARQLYAAENGLGTEREEVCRRAQRAFFLEHLGWWLPAFGVRLRAASDSPFYRAVARLVRALAAAERAVLGLPPFTELPQARPDSHQPEGSCFTCGLDAVSRGVAGAPFIEAVAGGKRR